MSVDVKDVAGFEPVGTKLPEYLPPLYRDFFTGVLEGKYPEPSPDQIENAVSQHFDFEPLTPLTFSEETDLISDMRKRYVYVTTDKDQWKAVAGNVYQISSRDLITGEPGERYGKPPLTPKQKEALLTDPDFYHRARITVGNWTSGLGSYGVRHLTEESSPDCYHMDNKAFLGILNSIRQFQGKDPSDRLIGLDIGGGTGLGANDAEKLDPNLQMTNLTANPELGVYPIRGGHTIMLAERMPLDFFEQFDLILSNMAFTYFRFPEIALNNALLALSVGGIMRISFDAGRSPLHREDTTDELMLRISDQFEILEQLRIEGVIQFLPDSEYWHAKDKFYPDGEKKYYQHGIVFLQKIQSMK